MSQRSIPEPVLRAEPCSGVSRQTHGLEAETLKQAHGGTETQSGETMEVRGARSGSSRGPWVWQDLKMKKVGREVTVW